VPRNIQTTLVTGGLGDIGRAIALKFANNGWRVVVNDIAPRSEGEARLEGWNAPYGSLLYLSGDNANRAEVEALLDNIEAKWSVPELVIANAGVVTPAPFLEMTEEAWRTHLDVNLTGAFHIAQASARRRVERGIAGSLLFTSSWVQDTPQANISAYCVSKSGLKMLAQTMALELGRYGIRANLVAPGIVMAGLSGRLFREGEANPQEFIDRIPLNALQSAEQVADAFWLLAQPEAAYITGSTLFADGGMSLFQFQPPKG